MGYPISRVPEKQKHFYTFWCSIVVNLPTEDLTWQPCRCWEAWVGPVLVDVPTVGVSVETWLGFVLSRDT